MAVIVTHDNAESYHGTQRHWVYNAMDCAITREVRDVLAARMDPGQRLTYEFEMACQSPAMQMNLRPLVVDDGKRLEVEKALTEEFKQVAAELDKEIGELWTKTEKETGTCQKSKRKDGKHSWPRLATSSAENEVFPLSIRCQSCEAPRLKRRTFNPMSDDDCAMLLYKVFKLPYEHNKAGKVSTDKEVLDRLERKAPKKVIPFVHGIKKCRQIHKQMEVLDDCRHGERWTTMVVGAADTGRWSSTENGFGLGGNDQNITEKLRCIFIAKPEHRLFYADLSQAESFCVAHLCGDEQYIDAHVTGDVHTVVCRMLWPELGWTGDLRRDKAWADSHYPPWDNLNTWRTQSKRNQHGGNYVKTAIGFARDAHIPQWAAKDSFERYHGFVRRLRPWHHFIADQVLSVGELTTPLGRRRQFFGRRYNRDNGGIDGHTHRQAVAYQPQSMVADLLNCGMWHIWNEQDPGDLWVLRQVHDAVLGQVPVAAVSKTEGTLWRLKELMEMPVRVVDFEGKARYMTIRTDIKVGENWAKYHAERNPGGMR